MALYETIGSIISDAGVELGLAPLASSGASAHSNTDPNFVLLWRLAKRVGRQLTLERDWVQLRAEHSFTTTTDVEYNLPTDFSRMVDQTGWNRTQDRRLHPSGEQLWQYLKATSSSGMLSFIFLPKHLTIEVWPQPAVAGETIAFKYQSRYWAWNGVGTATPNLSEPAAGSQYALFDPTLFVPALKLAYCRARGFDSVAAEEEYRAAFNAVASANVIAAPVLPIGPRHDSAHLVDEHNLPETGYGL